MPTELTEEQSLVWAKVVLFAQGKQTALRVVYGGAGAAAIIAVDRLLSELLAEREARLEAIRRKPRWHRPEQTEKER